MNRPFPQWPTKKLREIRPELSEDLDLAIRLLGPDHQETKAYEEFLDAIEAELEKRRYE